MITAAVTAIPYLRFNFRFAAARPELPGVCEPAWATAVLAAIFASARLQRRCSRTERVLASALALLGAYLSAHSAGSSLTSMRERAQRAAAALMITSAPGRGSQIVVVL